MLTENYNASHQSDFILIQDNTRTSTAEAKKDFLRRRNIEVLDWTECSPDCNLIEQLWAIIVQGIFSEEGKVSRIVKDLKNAV